MSARVEIEVESVELPAVLQTAKQIVDVPGVGGGLEIPGQALDERGHQLQGLKEGPVEHPGVARPDPPDPVGSHVLLQQPVTGVHGCFARPDDRVAGGGLVTVTRSLGEMTHTPGPISKAGVWVAGTAVSR